MFLHDAEFQTSDYRHRHTDAVRAQMGVWRWKGIQKHATRILELICGKQVLDIGGADGPLGFGSVVLDPKCKRSPYKTLQDAECDRWDVVFTSHTLEHIDNFGDAVASIFSLLYYGGYLIVHVPSWTCTRWRVSDYDNASQTPHLRTFCLSGDSAFREACCIDAEIAGVGFDIELAEHCGDDSILVIARKPC